MHSEGESSPEKETPSGQCPAPQETGPEKKRTIFIAAAAVACFVQILAKEKDHCFFLLSFCVCVATRSVS